MRRRFTQQRAVEQLRALAEPYRFRVQLNAERFPVIPGRYGQIEWYCDGVNCAARSRGCCALPGQFALAVHTDRARLFEKLWAIPGVKRYQTGETEMRAVFPPEALEQVARASRPAESARARGGPPERVQAHTQHHFRTLEAKGHEYRG